MKLRQIGSSAVAHLSDPMRRSSYALILSTGLTSALGLAFWVLAARLLNPGVVGTGAALTSAMTFLATVSTLGLRNGLVRFLALAGPSALRMVLTCYLVCGLTAVTAAMVFVIGQPWWAQNLGLLRTSPIAAAAFVAATGVWVIFVLEDHVLVGLRRAVWVPLANGAHSVVKMGVLPLMTGVAGWAILASFALPAAVIIAVVTVLLVARLGQSVPEASTAEPLRLRDLVRFAATDHFSALLWLATTELLTLVVLQVSGAEASAYYFMAFTIAYSLYLITSNVGSALVAEAARFPEQFESLQRQALRNAARLVIPLALVGSLVAPFALRLLGRGYEENGTTLLRLLILSAIPQVIVGISLSTARIRRDNRLIAIVYAALAVGVFGGTLLTLKSWGLSGVGWSWLLTQVVVALILLMAGLAPPPVNRRVLGRSIEEAGRARAMLRRRRSNRHIQRVLISVLDFCGVPRTSGYQLLTSDNDSLVIAVTTPEGPAVAKVSISTAASNGLLAHAAMVAWLSRHARLDHVRQRVPRLLRRGELNGHTVLLETRLPGSIGTTRPVALAQLRAAARAITEVHAATSAPTVADAELLHGWFDVPLMSLRRLGLPDAEVALGRLSESLYNHFDNRELTISCTHGDYWLGNVLFATEPDVVRVTGIVDWENARPDGLPDSDLVHLWLAAQPMEIGHAVRVALASPAVLRTALAELDVSLPNATLGLKEVVLTSWLWHVSAELNRATINGPSRIWVSRNVKPVLKLLGE